MQRPQLLNTPSPESLEVLARARKKCRENQQARLAKLNEEAKSQPEGMVAPTDAERKEVLKRAGIDIEVLLNHQRELQEKRKASLENLMNKRFSNLDVTPQVPSQLDLRLAQISSAHRSGQLLSPLRLAEVPAPPNFKPEPDWGGGTEAVWTTDNVKKHSYAEASGTGGAWGNYLWGPLHVYAGVTWDFLAVVPETRTYDFVPHIQYRGDCAVMSYDDALSSQYAAAIVGNIWIDYWQSDDPGGSGSATDGLDMVGWGDDNVFYIGALEYDMSPRIKIPLQANQGTLISVMAGYDVIAGGNGAFARLDFGKLLDNPNRYIACLGLELE